MSVTSLRGFQEDAVDSGVNLFTATKKLLDAAGTDVVSRTTAINHNGYLLIEAATGSGKTLMAGTIVERFSHDEEVVWFWFAPFKGVVGQTTAALREQFQGLRLRELADDRAAAMSRRGDVFVTTWQTVATRVKDNRNVRKEGDINPSIDTLIDTLREQGLRIGVVVDEAHHGFGEGTQAAKFFCEVLKPEYTILITATPDDLDIKTFEKAMGIAELQRIRVSRMDAVDAGLIKVGIKCAAYFVEPEKRTLVDLQGTALRDGVAAHHKIKQTLSDIKVPLVPLLLVQADSTDKSVEKLKQRLLDAGFSEDQIAVHTAAEPDASLLALANDEKREVLIFKMAVALGFDAPRAFTLVSMRASRDPDFGVQLVGRILRVHRRLHGRARAKTLPDALKFGYVFLADAETQTGLDLAGQRINAIQTEYAKASLATVALRLSDEVSGVGNVDDAGQISFFGLGPRDGTPEAVDDLGGNSITEDVSQSRAAFDFSSFFGSPSVRSDQNAPVSSGPQSFVGTIGNHRYALRADIPKRFKTQVVSAESDATEEECAQLFMISTRNLFDAMKSKIPVERRTIEVFTHSIQQEFNFAAELSHSQAAQAAQKALFRNKTFDPKELRRALLRKVEMVMRDETMSEADDPSSVAHFLNVILATQPDLLFEAQKAAHAKHAKILEAAELPSEITALEPLSKSPRNVYGVMPVGLNSWERPFAELLDHDANGIVTWWHRNEPRRPWSVNVLMPDGRGFYPDFVIGIADRKTEDGVLLADPKFYFQSDDEAPKVLAEHKTYGRVMIVYRDGVRWMTVGYDAKSQKPVLVRDFRLADAAGF
jgi:type III restriction enzyme